MKQFKQQSTGARVHVFYQLSENWYQSLSYGLRRDMLTDVSDQASRYIKQQSGQYIDSSLSQTLTYDKRNSRREPTSGYNISLSNTYSGIGGNVKYLNNKLSGNIYYTPLDNVTFNARATAGNVMKVSSQSIRMVDSIFLGNESFRGFAYGGLGPRDGDTKDPLGGTLYWVATLETLFPVGLPNEFGVKGSVFTDFGSVWKTAQKPENVTIKDSKAMRVSVGVGLSWKSPIGPLRFDYAIPIKKQSFDEPERFLFGVSSRF
jgi:outer membrane protein insertion porin family